MRLTRKDVKATVVVVGAAVFYVSWLTGTVAADMSTRVVTAIVFSLGWLGCTSDVEQMKVVFGVDGDRRPPLVYVVLVSIVGAIVRDVTERSFIIAGMIAIIWGNGTMLAMLVVAMAVLWIAATVRHQLTPRTALHETEHLDALLGRAA